jgi:predicted nuclease with TOPRIM domain
MITETETPTTVEEVARERVRYKELFEAMSDEKEGLAHDLQTLHREMQAVRERLDHQLKVISLQEQLIALLQHHSSWHWPPSPPINEEHPF